MIVIRRRHPSSITQIYFPSKIFDHNRPHRHASTPDPRFRIHPVIERNEFLSIGRRHYCADPAPTVSQMPPSLMILPTADTSLIRLSPLLIRISRQAL